MKLSRDTDFQTTLVINNANWKGEVAMAGVKVCSEQASWFFSLSLLLFCVPVFILQLPSSSFLFSHQVLYIHSKILFSVVWSLNWATESQQHLCEITMRVTASIHSQFKSTSESARATQTYEASTVIFSSNWNYFKSYLNNIEWKKQLFFTLD